MAFQTFFFLFGTMVLGQILDTATSFSWELLFTALGVELLFTALGVELFLAFFVFLAFLFSELCFLNQKRRQVMYDLFFKKLTNRK
jgi:hypothetical protein